MITQERLDEITSRIVSNHQPEKVVLGGSYATGKATKSSDLDLLEVSEAFYSMLEKLEDYAVDVRYPDEHFEITPDDAIEACEIAKLTKEFVLKRIDWQKPS